MLGMRNESIALSLTAILAQQKQLTIGLPPAPRERLLSSPMTTEHLYNEIVTASVNDPTMVMLTQEILVFLHLFITTEPQLFAGMIRIRVGLIIQVMLGELKRTLQSSDEDTADHLLNLSPYEIKCLLHIILSGKEFGITERSMKPAPELADLPKQERDMRIIRNEIKEASTRKLSVHLNWADRPPEDDDDDDMGKHGQWIRRRRLDGALNRVPVRFYGQVWQTLEKVRANRQAYMSITYCMFCCAS
jgi:phosphorylase kinase alpha/beta subunit